MSAEATKRAILVPIRTGRGQNDRGHWRRKYRKAQSEGAAVRWHLNTATKPPLPCAVLLTRLAPSNGLDDDNLTGSMKAVRDAVAAWLGVDDKRADVVRYRYAQERGPWGVRIEFHATQASPEAQKLAVGAVREPEAA